MSTEEMATTFALDRLGIAVTEDERLRRGWGWSMQNEKIIRPWSGPYATSAAAANAALDWVLEQTWRGVLHPILQADISADDRYPTTGGDGSLGVNGGDLLAPWLRAFERGVLADEVRPLNP
jgi:hypothetical protein